MATNNATNTSNPITVGQGGTGDSSLTAYAVLCGGTTSTGAVQSIASVGTSGQVLTSNGASALPTFQAAPGGSSVSLIGSATASSSASLTFTSLSSSYSAYLLVFNTIIPATSGANFLLRTSTNNGSSYDAASGNYAWCSLSLNPTAVDAIGSGSDTSIQIYSNTATTSNLGINGTLYITSPDVSQYCMATGQVVCYSSAGSAITMQNINGWRASATAVNAIQLLFSSGNIASGSIYLYGYPT